MTTREDFDVNATRPRQQRAVRQGARAAWMTAGTMGTLPRAEATNAPT
jgi:hypothetical protein